MGNTEAMKRKRAEQVRVTGVNKRNSHGRHSRAIEEVCSCTAIIQEKIS
jgi:hypothetical protein